jgi:hypothetical protein
VSNPIGFSCLHYSNNTTVEKLKFIGQKEFKTRTKNSGIIIGLKETVRNTFKHRDVRKKSNKEMKERK